MTTPTIEAVEYLGGDESLSGPPENSDLTQPLPERDVAEAISNVVEYSVDPITIDIMIMIRRGSDTGSFGWSSAVIA